MKKREIRNILFILPGFTGMLLVYGVPYGKLLLYSLQTAATDRKFSGLEQYRLLFTNPAFLKSLANTAVVCAIGLVLILPVSMFFAAGIRRTERLQSFLRSSLILPVFVPAVCAVMVWRILFDINGAMNRILQLSGLGIIDWMNTGWSKVMMTVMYIWHNTGYNLIIFTGALASLPADRVEAARLEGAGRIRVFFLVTVRHMAPACVFASVISIINALKLFREVYLITGDYPSGEMYFLGHFLNNMRRQMNYPRMAAAAMIFTLLSACVSGILFILEKQLGKDETN